MARAQQAIEDALQGVPILEGFASGQTPPRSPKIARGHDLDVRGRAARRFLGQRSPLGARRYAYPHSEDESGHCPVNADMSRAMSWPNSLAPNLEQAPWRAGENNAFRGA
ncbi:hypothetical protein FQR65_LT20311 [Abscondita terminalis]|nr:hypothetical protein FQR65_LT20311 [Abscondita terminalis]